ncbi:MULTISPECIES: hypothetical protein [unclassified Arsukibacterium]|uniref:baeRF3 domain-containing protein n=1 Tax=unclassified Arsukibacterium TaxID=2635278 RepID=UPI000C3984B3|nr:MULTISPECIES: hypothetical protein [unclassified Arsukibacterium]MBM34366.1 hypothetical protein [Rheinheimera sp.]|tara:strand:- start:8 stop:1168 length:1161 start_codon:yes stop_codon:yes gene_type:complete
MSEQLSNNTINELMNIQDTVCLSLYMPTHRSFPQRNENPILFKNLLSELSEKLQQQYPDANHAKLMQGFEKLQDDQEFWQHPQNGLAVFATDAFFKVLQLEQPVAGRTFVCDHPYISPLIRLTQSTENYQVLCLSRDSIRLFAGNRDTINEVSLHSDVPTTKEQALGHELTPSDQTGYHQGFGATSDRGDLYAHESGGNDKQQEIDIDRKRYFRAVDKAITEHHSQPSALPLILAALPENQGFFREVSHNSNLLADGVTVDLSDLDTSKLRQQCWQLMEKPYQQKVDAMLQQYNQSANQGLASNKLADIEQAAQMGRIATLLVGKGRLDVAKVDKYHASNEHPDLLEELVLQVIRHGGEVMVIPAERLPDQSEAAAVYRFELAGKE